MKKVVIYTNVYNGEKTIAQTIDSVLKQTYSNFEYNILDNGSTDNTRKIITEFATQDPRIVLHTREINSVTAGDDPPLFSFARSMKKSPDGYFAAIDGDDWWEPNYLERLIGFIEDNNLDIAITGTIEEHSSGETKVLRKAPDPIVLSQRDFFQYYPKFWTFPSTYWGNVMRQTVLPALGSDIPQNGYGADTIFMLHR